MEKKYFGSKFYSSTLNTVLLFILIVLMIVALRFMYKNESLFNMAGKNKCATQTVVIDKTMPNVENKGMILGNKDDLVAFSISPNTKVHGVVSYRGIIKGGYFFEGNILINILDSNKKAVVKSNAVAKTDWMTVEPVEFEGNIDFSKAPKGVAYVEIHNDNPSGLAEHDKSILIPVIVE